MSVLKKQVIRMNRMNRKTEVILGALALAMALPAQAADVYPVRAVRMVVPFAPGGEVR